ncbi:glycosyltransferase [Actinomadura livida]|uniref:Galactofuranosylgalactofuranosylrhamnosyl-N-acetylglucosaminyl-diphospho-decaprenol beta-1,5/1,6-galactofuranosyltransferase n=1 Tax=Actinomadura livida TaxID=79909 RepID=A0A7W7I9D5_9ACTN|nr:MULTISPECIES: glycosyltransferase [Actinomadura]MBB4772830.1 galactofuranosylgalactofuranosylrhamnosyl-N-acetylglucosaminyl-diphospho-decaprenol beta-1,5/1,6-galactofuranosyltransferase [Actinomadura catellatispora]GGU13027.1 glycosyl transferase [Actinomadura livida]
MSRPDESGPAPDERGGESGDGRGELRVLQRVVMPVDRDLDVLKLYVEGEIARGAEAVAAETAVEAELLAGPAEDVGRRSVVVPVGRRVSFATYFNAFPASYWRRWTSVDEVVLRVRARGQATVIVYRSSAKGHAQRVGSVRIDSATSREETFRLTLSPFIDGGWYWMDVLAGETEAVLERADWCAGQSAAEGVGQGRVSLGITTFNRPEFCVDQLLALARAPEVLDIVDDIYVVDQGTQRVRDDGRFGRAEAELGPRLRLIEQGNLGGSGGFSRAMDETLQAGRSDYVLLLDDDVVTETEGVLRAVAFADFARTPTIVGGHMFNLFARSQLHAYGETIGRYRWWWEEAPHTKREHDFAVPPSLNPRAKTSSGSLRQTKWLHRRVDVDYNGWWMCLIPVDVVRKVGLSMPMFIKWDDAEYCVRAGEAGFPTVSLPGMAAWHVPWQDKDDGIDWQAYFHERNRLVTALMHSPYERGGNLVKESYIISVKHALAMQYSTAELMLSAIEDVLSGPEHMHAGIATKLSEITAFRAAFPDARNRGSHEEFPQVRATRPPRRGRGFKPPRGTVDVLASAMRGTIKQLRPVDPGARANPQAVVPHIDRHWSLLSQVDSALVSSADGTKVAWYQRDPERFRRILARTSLLHARLSREWPELSGRYRAAMAELAAPEAWRTTFQAAAGTGDTASTGDAGSTGDAEGERA